MYLSLTTILKRKIRYFPNYISVVGTFVGEGHDGMMWGGGGGRSWLRRGMQSGGEKNDSMCTDTDCIFLF